MMSEMRINLSCGLHQWNDLVNVNHRACWSSS